MYSGDLGEVLSNISAVRRVLSKGSTVTAVESGLVVFNVVVLLPRKVYLFLTWAGI